MRILLSSCAALLLAACASPQGAALKTFDNPALAGTRWGLVVMTMDGRELVAIRPDERFAPASNTKLFTVAAAFQRLGDMTIADPAMGASLRLIPRDGGAPDIALVGGGDARLIDAADCAADCLSSLADMAVVNGVMKVHDVIGDDRRFPDERWGPGWPHEDLNFRSGAPASALTINSNELSLMVRPGAAVGDPVEAAWRDGDQFYSLVNEAVTAEAGSTTENLWLEHLPGSSVARLYGKVPLGAAPNNISVAAEDPALVAAWRVRRLLEQRGVAVEGETRALHRPLATADYPKARRSAPSPDPAPAGGEIGRLLPPPLLEDIRFLMKQSQNQHAEVLLRRLGLVEGGGSSEDGLAVVEAMLAQAGADRSAWDLSDGSGMSVYNRVTPRMVARFLRWTSMQPWGATYRDTLPVGGVDGTLSRRFKGTALEGHIFAKTGTLLNVTALSGFMQTAKGETLIFSAYANDRPSMAGSSAAAIDNALLAIAAAR